jgi:methionyl aminopeptidase
LFLLAMSMEASILEKYRKAGQIALEAHKLAVNVANEGTPLLDIAEKIEKFIISRGAFPAFPVNISINEVAAHYTPLPSDGLAVPKGSILKIDIGVHVDGYIADTAITIAFDPAWKKLSRAAFDALKSAGETLRPKRSIYDVSRAISEAIARHQYRPIENLTGHKVERYNLHAGKSIPNVPMFEYRLSLVDKGEVFAVEPFATNGRGIVEDKGWSNIYRVVSVKRVPGEAKLNDALEELWREFKSLPFAARWAIEKGFSQKDLDLLVKHKRLYHYPRLVEIQKGMVAQFEDTFIITDSGATPIVRVTENFQYLVE